METILITAIVFPFLLMLLTSALGGRIGRGTGYLALLAPVASTALLCWVVLSREAGTTQVVEFAWIPSLGLNATFLIDGLSLFFGLVVSGVGILVFFYATQYLDDHYEHHGRFYTYLLLFMGAMLGTVFAGNLLLLFVFWELTGIASFLLIGFLHEKESSRDGARMALLITSATGLAMLAGVVLLGQMAGTYELAELLGGEINGATREGMSLAFLLIACGAIGKSAQFPFHFWLPNAMAAPTPVSAYLHSATMVKLGVFLVGRVFPIFNGADLWSPVLVAICFTTMVVGALLALLSHDLKAILAYSTVSQLGFLIGFYGIGTPGGVHADVLHIANHVFYKGCLFMVVGIIDHATGVRDVRKLGGLRTRMPLLALIALFAGASMAGFPGSLGFISKEYMLKEKFDYWSSPDLLNWYPILAVIFASVLKFAFSVRIVRNVFWGKPAAGLDAHFHPPGIALQMPPLILASCCIVFGIWPAAFEPVLAIFHTPGLHHPDQPHLHLWHGVTPEFVLSMCIVAAGSAVYAVMQGMNWRWAQVPGFLRFDAAFEKGVNAVPALARGITRLLSADRPLSFLPIVFAVLVLAVGSVFIPRAAEMLPASVSLADFHPLRTFVVGLIAAAVFLVVGLRGWSGQLIALSIVGFLITFYFVLFRAPDLAMTQVLVESATLLLVLLLLARFPRSAQATTASHTGMGRRSFNLLIAASVGTLATALTLAALTARRPATSGEHFLESSVALAHGTNAVNTILVDFRGFDTLMEITVLLVATLGALGLFFRYRRSPAEYAAGEKGPAGFGVHHEGEEAHEDR